MMALLTMFCIGVCVARVVLADMGGPRAATPVSVGVSGVLKVVRALTPQDSGAFFNSQGNRVQW